VGAGGHWYLQVGHAHGRVDRLGNPASCLAFEKKAAEWAARFRRCCDDLLVNIAWPIQKIERGNRERGRTRDAADASGIELQHELGHRLPGHTAMSAHTIGRTNEPAGTPGDGNLEVKPRSNATPANRTVADAVRNKLAMLTVVLLPMPLFGIALWLPLDLVSPANNSSGVWKLKSCSISTVFVDWVDYLRKDDVSGYRQSRDNKSATQA
jgi:hypothetical protein